MSHFQQSFMLLLLRIPVQSSAVSNIAYMTLCEWLCQAESCIYMEKKKLIWPEEAREVKEKV